MSKPDMLNKVATFVERSAQVINTQAAAMQKQADAHAAALKLVPSAVEAANNAKFILNEERVKAAEAFGNHEKLLQFFIKVAEHFGNTVPAIGTADDTTKTASAAHAPVDEATRVMAERLGCLDEVIAANS